MSEILNRLIEAIDKADKLQSIVESEDELTGYSKRLNQFFDEDLVNWWKEQLERDSNLKSSFFKRARRLMNQADHATTEWEKLKYEFRILLSDEKADLLAREYYQKAIRNRTFSNTDVHGDEDDTDGFLNTAEEYVTWNSNYSALPDNSIFLPAYSQLKRSVPERKTELMDLFDKLLNKSGLSRNDKITLIARLILGVSYGGRSYGGAGKNKSMLNKGLSLESVMNKQDLPDEYREVERQIDKLIEAGLPEDQLTFNKIIFGDTITDDQGNSHKVDALIRDKNAPGKSQKALQAALAKIAGTDPEDIDKIKDFLYVNEAKDRNSLILTVMGKMIDGDKPFKLPVSQLITVIVGATQQNILSNTPLGKLAIKEGIKNFCKRYLDKAKSKEGQDDILDLIMMPVLFDKSNKKELGLK